MTDPQGDGLTRAGKIAAALITLRAALRGRRHSEPPSPPPESQEDPSERSVPANRTAETVVAWLLILAAVFGFGFTAVYVILQTQTQLLGVAIGGMLACLAAACIIAG